MSIKCGSCVACCGPVPVSINELNVIKDYVRKMKTKEVKRLSKQKRSPMQCMFVDTKNKRCSIYEARPELCKKFGYVKGLPCPHFPDEATEKDNYKPARPIGVLGQSITWDNLMEYGFVNK